MTSLTLSIRVKYVCANQVVPDQASPRVAVWSVTTCLFSSMLFIDKDKQIRVE